MPETPVESTQLKLWLQRIRAGDMAARDELLRNQCGRLERLARKMIKRFPKVQRWAQTDDVLQSSLVRLLRALEKVEPNSMREFFALAAEQMRRELIDLGRHFFCSRRAGAHYARSLDQANEGGFDAVDETEIPEELDKWCAFHQEVERLPVEEREVVGLLFYHGWTQMEVAELFQVTVRTVQRRWQSALVKLHRLLKEQPPPE